MVKLMNDNKAAQADNETNVASSSEATLTNVDEAITLAATVPAEMPGSLLAARRKELRWSVEEIAGKLKLAPRQIVAIESDDFTSLPGMATVRGFIRSYAKILGLDPEQLVSLLVNEPNPAFDPMVLRRPLPSTGFQRQRYSAPGRHRNTSRRMMGLGLLVLIFLVALAFAGRQIGWFALPVPPSLISEWMPAEKTASDAPVEVAAPAMSPTQVDLPTEAKSSSKAKLVAGKPAVALLEATGAVDPARALEIRLREDAWVEISSQNGTKLVSRLMKAGTTERFEVNEPVVLVVGNAVGVEVRLRGQSLNLRSVARDNVSKLSIK